MFGKGVYIGRTVDVWITVVEVDTVGGVDSAGRVPQAPSIARITKDIIDIRFDLFIDRSISASQHCHN